MEQSVLEKYLSKTAEPAPPQQGTIYTCPMHPQIRQDAPGNCPICGMALEPVSAAAETGPSPELIDMTRRFWTGTALAVPTVILEMGGHFPGLNLHRYLSPEISIWLQFLLATPVVLWAGWPFFVRGWASVRNRSLNMFSLIALGVGAAFLYSLGSSQTPCGRMASSRSTMKPPPSSLCLSYSAKFWNSARVSRLGAPFAPY